MAGGTESESWYDNSYKKKKKKQKKGSSATQQGKMTPVSTENEKDFDDNVEVTDSSTVNLQANVFTKVAKTFTLLFSMDTNRYDRRPEAPGGWTTTGELGLLRSEQDAQYEFMEELELKIEELKMEVEQQKRLIKAYETRVNQRDEYLQHCMHWITMAQTFGDVPVAKDRMNWKAGRDTALVGPDEVVAEDVVEDDVVEHVNNVNNVDNVIGAQHGKGVRDVQEFKCIHAINATKAK
ncbi:hypothetical protein V8C42DRAFT_211678 [Trichoderma barbatum]